MWDFATDGLRQFLRHPFRSLAIIASLGVALGGSLSVYQVWLAAHRYANSYGDPGRVYVVWEDNAARRMGLTPTSVLNYLDIRNSATSFAELGAFTDEVFTVGGPEAEKADGVRCTASFLRTGGVGPMLGRLLEASDENQSQGAVVVIGAALWRRRFGNDPGVLGRAVLLNGVSHTIVGVMPPSFAFPPAFTVTAAGSQVTIREPDLWVPLTPGPLHGRREARFLFMAGRLRAGAEASAARAELDVIASALRDNHARENAGTHLMLASLPEQVTAPGSPALAVLAASMLLLWITALANGATLTLSGVIERAHAIAVRLALGATPLRIRLSLAVVILCQASAAAVIAVPAALVGARLALGYLSGVMPGVHAPELSAATLAVAAAASWMGGLLMLVPSLLLARRIAPGAAMRTDGAGAVATRLHWASWLVFAQVAMSAAGVFGAGRLVRGADLLERIDLGFRSEGVVVASLTLPRAAQPLDRVVALQRDGLARLSRLYHVEQVASVDHAPLGDSVAIATFTVETTPDRPDQDRPRAVVRAVGGAYFDALQVVRTAGRVFTGADGEATTLVAVVNERFAELYFDGTDPVGHRVKRGRRGSAAPWMTIVGVVRSSRAAAPGQEPGAEVFVPYAQGLQEPSLNFVIKSSGSSPTLARDIQATLKSLDASLPPAHIVGLDDVVAAHLGHPEQHARIGVMVAGVAILLTAFGLYATTVLAMAIRRRDLAMRLCLGATWRSLQADVLSGIATRSLTAGAVGATCTLAAIRSLPAGAVDARSTDPLIWVVSVLAVMLVMAAAGLGALRAYQAQPADLLRPRVPSGPTAL
ncbi:MAG TPA: ABC transporter permease [Vicinamibacterales bacterium]|nr:ABC transporter permease [Vicinamibacterales bacterium]